MRQSARDQMTSLESHRRGRVSSHGVGCAQETEGLCLAQDVQLHEGHPMRIFAAGLATETNSFSNIPTGLRDFAVTRRRDIDPAQPDFGIFSLFALWQRLAQARGDEFTFGLMAFAQPAGCTTRAAFECLRDELLELLVEAGSVDIVLLNLHGAMIAEGYDDCEEDLITRVRQRVGPSVVIAVELDLHCHLSPSKIARADLVITYKEYPHTDVNDRARELFELAIRTRSGEVRPTTAIADCCMMGIYPTSEPAMLEVVDLLKKAERHHKVLSVSFVHGFTWGDVMTAGSKMLVITDNDPELARQIAAELTQQVLSRRHRFGFPSLSMEEALSRALTAEAFPVVVADQSDNPGAGAPGDATFALRWLLDRRAQHVAIAILYDPQVVCFAKASGEGATLSVRMGGKLGPASGDPVDCRVTVIRVLSDYWHQFPQHDGSATLWPLGDIAAVRCDGIDLVLSSQRSQCFSPSIFEDCGIEPQSKRVLIVKSLQHFYGAFSPIASEIIYMAGPGAVVPDVRHIPYRHLNTSNMYPWNELSGRSASGSS
jgi:microcystin degradation protein MlrC